MSIKGSSIRQDARLEKHRGDQWQQAIEKDQRGEENEALGEVWLQKFREGRDL